MPVAASAGSSPSADRMRTAPAWILMPTPSGRSSPTASKTSTSNPARCRHMAARGPPMPAPAITTFMSRIAAETVEQERRLIGGPALLIGVAELAKVGPAVDAGVVLVVEHDANGVVTDRFDRSDLHMPPAADDLLGPRSAMALHFRRWALHPQIFSGQAAALAVGEVDLDPALG